MVLRLLLKDKSSVLVYGVTMNEIYKDESDFIKVINYKTNKAELYNKDYIWGVRISSESDNTGKLYTEAEVDAIIDEVSDSLLM